MLDFKHRVALVTGGGAGIGRATAELFGELGAQVAVLEIDADRCKKVRSRLSEARVDALVQRGDAADAADVDALLSAVDARFGRLDVLVNNVGDFLGMAAPFADTTPAGWDALYRVNLHHVFLVTHAALPLLRRTGAGGSIINVSTIEAFRGIPNAAVYSAFKSAITGFTRSLALELAPEGIRVNAIAPETTETEQVPISSWIPEEYKDLVPRFIPLGRYGQPRDVAGSAVFLASELASWITGTTINLDGGALAAGGWRQTRDGRWTNRPVIEANAHRTPRA